jgi:hypothetical protein
LGKYVRKNFIILTEYFVYHILLLWSKDLQINLSLAPKNLGIALILTEPKSCHTVTDLINTWDHPRIVQHERFLKHLATKTIRLLAGAYLDLLLGGETQFFFLIQAQNLQVKFLVIFKSSESLIIVVLFIYFIF